MADPLKTIVDDVKRRMATKLDYAKSKIPPNTVIPSPTIKKYLAGISKMILMLAQTVVEFQTDAMKELKGIVTNTDNLLMQNCQNDTPNECVELIKQFSDTLQELKDEIKGKIEVAHEEKSYIFNQIRDLHSDVIKQVQEVLVEQGKLYKQNKLPEFDLYRKFLTEQFDKFKDNLKQQRIEIDAALRVEIMQAGETKRQLGVLIEEMKDYIKKMGDIQIKLQATSTDIQKAANLVKQTNSEAEKSFTKTVGGIKTQIDTSIKDFNNIIQGAQTTLQVDLTKGIRRLDELSDDFVDITESYTNSMKKDILKNEQIAQDNAKMHDLTIQKSLEANSKFDLNNEKFSQNLAVLESNTEDIQTKTLELKASNLEIKNANLVQLENNKTLKSHLDSIQQQNVEFKNNLTNLQEKAKQLQTQIETAAETAKDLKSAPQATTIISINKNLEEMKKEIKTTSNVGTEIKSLKGDFDKIAKKVNEDVDSVKKEIKLLQEANTQSKDADLIEDYKKTTSKIIENIENNFKQIKQSLLSQASAFDQNQNTTTKQVQENYETFSKRIQNSIDYFDKLQASFNQAQGSLNSEQQEVKKSMIKFIQDVDEIQQQYQLIRSQSLVANQEIQTNIAQLADIFGALKQVIIDINQLQSQLIRVFTSDLQNQEALSFQNMKDQLIQINGQIQERSNYYNQIKQISDISVQDVQNASIQQKELRNQLLVEQQKLYDLKAQKVNEQQSSKQINSEVIQKRSEKEKLDKKIESQQQKLNQLQQEIEEKTKQSIQTLTEMAKTNNQLLVEKGKASETISLYSKKINDLDAIASKFKELQEIQTALQQEIDTKRDKIDKLTAKYGDLVTIFNVLQSNTQREESRYNAIQEEILTSKSELNKVREVIRKQLSIKNQIEDLKKQKLTKRTFKELQKAEEEEEEYKGKKNLNLEQRDQSHINLIPPPTPSPSRQTQQITHQNIQQNPGNPLQNNFFPSVSDYDQDYDTEDQTYQGRGKKSSGVFDDLLNFLLEIDNKFEELKESKTANATAGIFVGAIGLLVAYKLNEKRKKTGYLAIE